VYVQPHMIVKRYSLGRTTVWRLLKEMKAMPKYKKSFLDQGWQLKLVKLVDFEQFMQERNQQYLRK
jgi:hypothetical protein